MRPLDLSVAYNRYFHTHRPQKEGFCLPKIKPGEAEYATFRFQNTQMPSKGGFRASK